MNTLADLVARAPNNAVDRDADVLHKRWIDELVDHGGNAAAAAAYELERFDGKSIDLPATAVVACVVVRNEADRIPALLAHHRRLGVERFFVVDNNSTDDTRALLLGERDVHVWSAASPFQAANFGAAWFDVLLREHARGHWVVLVDADELLWYPECESRSLPELCAALDANGHRAFGAAFLDMYADAPLADTHVPRGTPPLDVCRYFDRRWYHTMSKDGGPFHNQVSLHGGVRRRAFGGQRGDYCLNKVPLLRFDVDTVLVGGQHATNLTLAPTRGAVLHFKLDARLARHAACELARGQRAAHASEYHAYVEALALNPKLSLHDSSESIELTSSAQLVELGVMGAVEDPDHMAKRAEAFLRLAETKYATHDRRRAVAYLRRAADTLPTSISPLLRVAEMSSADDDGEGRRALDEAAAREPDDFALLELVEPLQQASVCPPAPAVETDGALLDECVDFTFGRPDRLAFRRRVHTTPWVGAISGVPRPPAHLSLFARHGLAALWATPELQRSLEHCRGLYTFSEHAGEWLRAHSPVPVTVVAPSWRSGVTTFDFTAFARSSDRRLVQLGWWMSRVNSICDLPLAPDNALRLRKVRVAPAGHRRTLVALARAERAHGGWRDHAALATTTDAGVLAPREREDVLRSAVVFADLYDANADPVVLECVSSATPVLVNRHPAVVEHLGRDYPLYFDSLDDAASKLVDLDVIEAAHRHLAAMRGRAAEAGRS